MMKIDILWTCKRILFANSYSLELKEFTNFTYLLLSFNATLNIKYIWSTKSISSKKCLYSYCYGNKIGLYLSYFSIYNRSLKWNQCLERDRNEVGFLIYIQEDLPKQTSSGPSVTTWYWMNLYWIKSEKNQWLLLGSYHLWSRSNEYFFHVKKKCRYKQQI